MGLITQYLNFQKKYEEQYGPRTVVLMQVGTFYEIYEYNVEYCTSEEAKIDKEGKVWNESIGHAIDLSVALNSVLTHEDSNEPYSISNPHKMGFPVIAWEKNRITLLSNDYVIVRIDQVKGSKNTTGLTERYVSEICSPTMQMDNITSSRPTSNIACIYIEYQHGMNENRHRYENFLITTGASVVDIITGQNRVCEFYSKVEDQVSAVQELYRFLISHYPRELIIHINDMPAGLDKHTDDQPNLYIKYLERVLELKRFDRLTCLVNSVPAEYRKVPYQVEFLNKILNKQVQANQTGGLQLNIIQKRNERIIEDLGLERMNYGRISYMLLMQHCHSHNADIINRLSKPDLQWLDEKKHLILTHNAIVQLDLIPPNESNLRLKKGKEINSLMSVLDQNQTHLGRRALSTILQNPMLNPDEIKSYYNMVDEMLTGPDPLWSILDRQLKELPDIGRLQRKLEIKLITPKELAILFHAYIKIINIYVMILRLNTPVLHSQMLSKDDVNNFNGFIARFMAIVDFKALECCHIDSASESNATWLEFVDCPIRMGIYPDLDEQTRALVMAENSLQQIVDHLNTFIATTKGKKIEFKAAKKKQGAKKQDPTGTILTTTTSKANMLSNAPVNVQLCGVLQILPNTTTDKIITSNVIQALCSQIDTIKMWMRQRLLSIYESIIEEMVSKYTFYVPIANLIAKLDLIHSYAKVSHQYNYHRPELVTEGDVSYLEVRNARHPIIERIIDGAYVTNDVFLGNGQVQQMNGAIIENGQIQQIETSPLRSNGILLFGVNQTGKSSLGKTLALLIIMAQIGCYVPGNLKFKPYSKIITRLSGNDNIFQGQSSFAVEMTELRTILRQADQNTLVIGDELAKGTEHRSGMAISASAILQLVERKSTFIFATHMHELLKLSYISKLPREALKIYHLSVTYDEVTKILTYDRKMKDGSGSALYGLMVVKSLGLPDTFIDIANEVLLEITNINKDILPTKTSRYNSKVYVDACAVCGKTNLETELHSHHLIEQKFADEKQMVKVVGNQNGNNIDIGIMHKNAKDNLVILCKGCHTELHKNNKELETLDMGGGKLIRMKPNVPIMSN